MWASNFSTFPWTNSDIVFTLAAEIVLARNNLQGNEFKTVDARNHKWSTVFPHFCSSLILFVLSLKLIEGILYYCTIFHHGCCSLEVCDRISWHGSCLMTWEFLLEFSFSHNTLLSHFHKMHSCTCNFHKDYTYQPFFQCLIIVLLSPSRIDQTERSVLPENQLLIT